ncbi:MAG: transferrin-binding protein-like solute binding protein [Cardiobacteriaceae bacterium]|nr:transferrin-binding protein-like solute binding protein [Cardiobacteriaceae bacterium]
MKLSNLSLAILVAMGVAACGGSDSNDAPKDPQTPSTPAPPPPPVVPPSTDNVLVDPTGTDVVENFNPAQTPSVGTLQYIRRANSAYDLTKNPSKQGSSTPLLNVDLDQQNPKLTNIVLARKNENKVAGTPQLVQFFGGTSGEAFDATGKPYAVMAGKTYQALQVHNFKNVDLFVDHLPQMNTAVKHDKNTADRTPALPVPAAVDFPKGGPAVAVGTANTYLQAQGAAANKAGIAGKDLVWWTAGAVGQTGGKATAFENTVTNGGLDAAVTGVDATNGLIRIGGLFKGTQEALPTLGQEKNKIANNKWEDHHRTTTRIFGNYHLGYVPAVGPGAGSTQRVALNSFDGAASFAAVNATPGNYDSKVIAYSLGAHPITLEHVQYGRVTNNLDEVAAVKVSGTFWHSPDLKKGDSKSVDNYFYRGTRETSIADMAKLPTDQVVTYKGHALMYGIDNGFHKNDDKGQPLPNAFLYQAAPEAIGLGNFVKAQVDFGKQRVAGYVYNAWLLNNKKADVTENKLVQFAGNITGNTVIGTADRTYISGDEKADFRASFFGAKANEMGGSFNSITTDQKYGNEGWGGVFGAQRTIAVTPDSNTFLGDDGNSVYSL